MAGKPEKLNIACRECKTPLDANFLPYVTDSYIGNCGACGCFHNIKDVVLANRFGCMNTQP